jgi:hypothetical protein
LKGGSFKSFNDLAMAFLMHHQLPIRYEIGIDLLTSLRQDNAMHISDHIHEWRQRLRMIKTHILDKLLVKWFTNSFLPPISRDVAMVGVTTEEKDILCVQHLDMIYSQSRKLYDIIPNAPRLSIDPRKTNPGHHVDGVVGFFSHASVNRLANQMGHISISSTPSASSTNAQTIKIPSQTS